MPSKASSKAKRTAANRKRQQAQHNTTTSPASPSPSPAPAPTPTPAPKQQAGHQTAQQARGRPADTKPPTGRAVPSKDASAESSPARSLTGTDLDSLTSMPPSVTASVTASLTPLHDRDRDRDRDRDLIAPTIPSSSAVQSLASSKHPHKKGARRHSFRSRSSPLDYETLVREQNPMRGFFVLFWMFMAAYVLTTAVRNYKAAGSVVSLEFFYFFSQDAWALIITDMLMVGSMFMAVVVQQAIARGSVKKEWALAIQHVWQLLWFSGCLFAVFAFEWPWTQSGFLVLHSIAMLLKQHSYYAYNTELHFKLDRLHSLRAQLSASKKDDDKLPESDDAINAMQIQVADLEHELVKPSVAFPANITFYNFFDYLLVPTLVYELEYPRTEKFRPLYFLEKVVATLSTFGLLYLTYEHYIVPVIHDMPNTNFAESIIHLVMPFMVCYLLIFFIIFECICNAFAELTLFADREFYDDWWNSTTFDEYARKWNKPVHEFLLRHIYLEGISTYKLSKNDATLLTFFLSACLHELVLLVIGRRLRFYFFGLQMFQIPLIYFARIPAVRKQRLFGNLLFWFGMFLGPPLLAVAYLREHYA
ncbi:MBOAT, membrane-bound O-acyltransferase family-domain-containing protein [Entophlyctis helioformis]|nr:MBOAT, membrane-bound O-acyltransferase family-domain-containing protein [Entophlyctis helioformis]